MNQQIADTNAITRHVCTLAVQTGLAGKAANIVSVALDYVF
jgi:hypothetical protein